MTGRQLAKEDAKRTVRVGDHQPAGAKTWPVGTSPETLLGPAHADPKRAIHTIRVERPYRYGSVNQRDCEDVRQQSFREKTAVEHPVQDSRLDRRSGDVWVETDLTKEDPVGGRYRLLADIHRPRSAPAIGKFAQARPHRRR